MGRGATIAAGNVWYEARIEAAKSNEKLSSRFGAADEAGMSEDAIKNTELGLEKQMPVDKAVILAELYGAPNLLNYYCLNECPIGRNRPVSYEMLSIEQVAVKIMKRLRVNRVQDIKDRLVDIAEDGAISDEEMEDLIEVQEYLDEIYKVISQLRNIVERVTWQKKSSTGQPRFGKS